MGSGLAPLEDTILGIQSGTDSSRIPLPIRVEPQRIGHQAMTTHFQEVSDVIAEIELPTGDAERLLRTMKEFRETGLADLPGPDA